MSYMGGGSVQGGTVRGEMSGGNGSVQGGNVLHPADLCLAEALVRLFQLKALVVLDGCLHIISKSLQQTIYQRFVLITNLPRRSNADDKKPIKTCLSKTRTYKQITNFAL